MPVVRVSVLTRILTHRRDEGAICKRTIANHERIKQSSHLLLSTSTSYFLQNRGDAKAASSGWKMKPEIMPARSHRVFRRKRVANSGPQTAEDGERGRSPKAIRFRKTGFSEQAEFGRQRRVVIFLRPFGELLLRLRRRESLLLHEFCPASIRCGADGRRLAHYAIGIDEDSTRTQRLKDVGVDFLF